MIQSIRNPWLRRSVLITALVFYVPFLLAWALLGTLWSCGCELWQDVPAAWRGPACGR